jgi:tetratricopeptide (TPR) repeat protein
VLTTLPVVPLAPTLAVRPELETACKLDPLYADALEALAVVERTDHHLGRSTELFRKVAALEPSNSHAKFMIGRNLQDMGRAREAIDEWRLAMKSDPNNTEVLYGLARALSKTDPVAAKKYRERFQALQQQQLLTDGIQSLGNFGLKAAAEKRWAEAISDIRQALKMCGNCPQGESLHKNLGLIYAREGDVAEAQKELSSALELKPNDRDAIEALKVLGARQ